MEPAVNVRLGELRSAIWDDTTALRNGPPSVVSAERPLMPVRARIRPDAGWNSLYPVNVILSVVVLTIMGLAVLIVLGAAAYGIALAVAEGLASHMPMSGQRGRLSAARTGPM
jgi:hypothetical protein